MDKRVFLLVSLICLIIGGIIYILLRSEQIYFIQLLYSIGLEQIIKYLRNIEFFSQIEFPTWFVYNFPDGLWVFSGVNFMFYLFYNDFGIDGFLYALAFPIIAFSHEVFQGIGMFPGTFDLLDIYFYFFASIISLIYYFIFRYIKVIKIKYTQL